MGKKKARTKRVYAQRSEKKENPFEVRAQKSKKPVLNSKLKGTVVKSVEAKTKGQSKRETTLAVEFERKNFANEFIDRRWPDDASLPPEDKALMLFMRERERQWQSEGPSLAGEIPLTHRGKEIGDLGNENPFGGLEKKKAWEDTEVEDDQSEFKPKSQDQILKDIIAKSKFYKYEKQKQRDQQMTLTDSLDAQLSDVVNLLMKDKSKNKNRNSTFKESEIPEIGGDEKGEGDNDGDNEEDGDDNDSEEGDNNAGDSTRNSDGNTKDQSGDALDETELNEEEDDGDDEDNEDGDDGEKYSGNKEVEDENGEDNNTTRENSTKSNRNSTPQNTESASAMDDFELLVKQFRTEPRAAPTNPLKNPEEVARAEKERLEQLEQARISRMRGENPSVAKSKKKSRIPTEGGGDDLDDGLSYKGVDDQDDDVKGKRNRKRKRERDEDGDEEEDDNEVITSDLKDEISSDTKSSTILPTSGALPFTFEMPTSYSGFSELLREQSLKRQKVILDRIFACHRLSLNDDNKKKLRLFLSYLMNHVVAISRKSPISVPTLDLIFYFIFQLTQEIPVIAGVLSREFLNKMWDEIAGPKSTDGWPSSASLMLNRLFSMIWPVSDRRHVITTPATILMASALARAHIKTVNHVKRGLFLCNLFISYIAPGRRFASEPFNYLMGVICAFMKNFPVRSEIKIPSSEKAAVAEIVAGGVPTEHKLSDDDEESSDEQDSESNTKEIIVKPVTLTTNTTTTTTTTTKSPTPKITRRKYQLMSVSEIFEFTGDTIISAAIRKFSPEIVKITGVPQVGADLEHVTPLKVEELNSPDDDPALLFSLFHGHILSLQQFCKIYSEDFEDEIATGSVPTSVAIGCLFVAVRNVLIRMEKSSGIPSETQSLISKFLAEISLQIEKNGRLRKPLKLFSRPPSQMKLYTPEFRMEYTGHASVSKESKEMRERKKLQQKIRENTKGAERELRLDTKFIAMKKQEKYLEKQTEKKHKQKEIKKFLSEQSAEEKNQKKTTTPRKKRKTGF